VNPGKEERVGVEKQRCLKRKRRAVEWFPALWEIYNTSG
jgi:hypothetical protein